MHTTELKTIANLYREIPCDNCRSKIPVNFPFLNVCGEAEDEDHPGKSAHMWIVDLAICVSCVGEQKDTLDQMIEAIALGAVRGIEKSEQTGSAIKP